MRNVAFLGAGLVLLLVQANLFRLLDRAQNVTAMVVFFFVALAFDVWLLVREIKASAGQGKGGASFRGYATLPAALLLIYAIVAAVLHQRLPPAIPSLLLPIIVFMGVHEYSLARGAAVAFVLGYAADLVSITPVGLQTFTFVATFVMARTAGVRLAAQTTWMQAVLAVAFTVVVSVIMLMLLAIFGRESDGWTARTLYPLALPHALATGAIAPPVFRLCQRIHQLTSAAPRPEPGRASP